jgi:hypothetical protein
MSSFLACSSGNGYKANFLNLMVSINLASGKSPK